jgi:hypothetical protein
MLGENLHFINFKCKKFYIYFQYVRVEISRKLHTTFSDILMKNLV